MGSLVIVCTWRRWRLLDLDKFFVFLKEFQQEDCPPVLSAKRTIVLMTPLNMPLVLKNGNLQKQRKAMMIHFLWTQGQEEKELRKSPTSLTPLQLFVWLAVLVMMRTQT